MDLIPNTEQVENLLKSRRSIHNFLDKPAPRETPKEIIETANYAPTGQNSQTVRWMVIEDKRDVRKHAEMTIDWLRSTIIDDPAMAKRLKSEIWVGNWDKGMDSITWNAAHMVIAYAEGTRWEEECKIAVTFLDLAAYSHGLEPAGRGYSTWLPGYGFR